MESLPNEVVLMVFSYLRRYDVVNSFYRLNSRYARLIEEFQPFSTSIDLIDAPFKVVQLYSTLLFGSRRLDRSQIVSLRVDCYTLKKFSIDQQTFPNLQSLSIVVRRTNELEVLIKYFSSLTNMKQLFIRSDVCCCDRILFEENVKKHLFQTKQTRLQSLTFATPPCYSISLQDVSFERCLFTNLTLTVRSIKDFCLILANANFLRSLRIRVLDSDLHRQHPITIRSPPPNLENLLFICLHSIPFEVIKNIFKTLTPLKKLSFSLVFDIQSGIIDGHRLRDEILIHLPNLSTIQFEIKAMLSLVSNSFIESFKTPFWSRFSPIGFHEYDHIYTLPFPFHHLNFDQSIIKRQQTRESKQNWRWVRDADLYDVAPYSNEFLVYLRDEFSRLTTLTLKWKFDLIDKSKDLSTWFSLPTVRRLTIKSAHHQRPDLIEQLLLCLPNCDTLDCDYVLIARATCYFRPGHRLSSFGKRLRLLLVDELPADWKNPRKKKKNVYFQRFRSFFPNIECPLYD